MAVCIFLRYGSAHDIDTYYMSICEIWLYVSLLAKLTKYFKTNSKDYVTLISIMINWCF